MTATAAPAGMDPRTRRLLDGPIVPTLLRMAAPNVVVMVVQASVGLIETYFVGKLGTDALAGVTLVFPVLMLMQMMSAGAMGGGISSSIARALGAGRRADADALVQHALAISLLFGFVFMAAVLGGGRWLYGMMGGSGAALEAALTYSGVIFWGAVLLWLFNALANVIRGTGNMMFPALVTCIGAVALIPLSPCLIFGWGPLPRLGIAGGAYAVVAYYGIGTLVFIVYLMAGRSVVRLAPCLAGFRRALFADILRIGAIAALISLQQAGKPADAPFDPAFIDALRRIVQDDTLEPAFTAEAIGLPDEDFIADRMPVVDVEAIHAARKALRRQIATALRGEFERLYAANRETRAYSPDAGPAGRRALKNSALGYLAALAEEDAGLRGQIAAQYRAADNMTDRMAALRLLVDIAGPERQAALDDFYARFRDDALVLDKWLVLQAVSVLPDTLERVKALLQHPAFSMQKPNKVRSLIGGFTMNALRYHAADGSGYAFHADRIIALDPLNPQVAARLLAPLGRWRHFDAGRQAKMKAELQRVLAAPKLSRETYEIASKSLGS